MITSFASNFGTYAAIDLGTNNCRLLIGKPTPHSFATLESFSKITRLGEGLAEDGEISEKAAERTIIALKKCAQKLKKFSISQARFIATATCRRASNGKEFIRNAKRETGLNIEIISEQEEARLGVVACVPLLNRQISRTLVFDIGGGSTQVSWAHVDKDGDVKIEGFTSIPMGVVTVMEGFKGYEITSKDYKIIAGKMLPRLEDFEKKHNIRTHIANNEVQMIGTSGTITTLAAIHLNLDNYVKMSVDGVRMSFDDAFKVQKKLERMTSHERATHPCIGEKRTDLVMAGCAILDAILKFWPVGEITVADRGLREGVLMDLMARKSRKVRYSK